ncbi:MAG TPA: type II toxin-antitoxin system VapC family toxin [Candidatus Lokiarchaeia archaeon]|nr:type II toxin-antitoxin system VapC family toxin [Candidatus Lokiarchaeia archaeon]
MVILIDSNVMIGFLTNDEAAVTIFEKFVNDKELICISAISVYEIYLGIMANLYLKDGRPSKVPELLATYKQFLQKVDMLSFTRGAAERAGEIRAQSLGKGLSIKEKDCQIAGITLERGVDKVITRDEHDFKKIFELTGLKFEFY